MSKIMKTAKKFEGKALILGVVARNALCNKRGEGFVDTAVKILMSVVIGALVLGGLYLLFSGTVLPTLTSKIQAMFNFKG